MEIFRIVDKKFALYTTIAIAGLVFISKKLFSKKINKKFFNKEKKKTIRKFNILFSSLYKNIEIRTKDKVAITTGTLGKLKSFCEKIYDEKVKDDHPENINLIKSRQDQIFYYILQNVSNMIIQNNQKKE
jgi:hypothetical protein